MNSTESKPHRGMPKGRTGNPAGRPPLGDKKKKILHIRLNPELYEWIKNYAASSGKNLTESIETALLMFKANKEA